MSTEAVGANATRRSGGRRSLAAVLCCFGVVAAALALGEYDDVVFARSYTVVAQGRAGDHGWVLIAERPRWIGDACLSARSEGAYLTAACGSRIDPDAGAEPTVTLVPDGGAWLVFGAVPAAAHAAELQVQVPGEPARTLRLAASGAGGFDARCYAGTFAARADATIFSVAPDARVTRVFDRRGEPISWP